jgi:hypothetical protein
MIPEQKFTTVAKILLSLLVASWFGCFPAESTAQNRYAQNYRKSYRNTVWADEFVTKFSMSRETLKTDFDKEFAKKWKESLRDVADITQYVANNPQDRIYNPNERFEKIRILRTTVSMLSQNAQKEFRKQLESLSTYLKEFELKGYRL